MRRKMLATAGAVALVFSTAAVATADPGPNGDNTFGLCTAYHAGSETGQEQKRKAPPFQGLEAAADAAGQSVAEYCAENGQRPGNGKGPNG
jgi:hypothetical protein